MTDNKSRRINVYVIKYEPLTRDQFIARNNLWLNVPPSGKSPTETYDDAYRQYLDRFQPYRWQCKGMNGEITGNGERYFNESDAWDNVALNFGDDTTVYAMPMYGEDRSERWMRFGDTDRKLQATRFLPVEPTKDLLLQYSEWLDVERIDFGDESDKRTHTDLINEFVSQRDVNAFPALEES